MLDRIKLRLRDVNTLRRLFLQAEACARADGVAEPESEHLVMAALALPDETAIRAFERIGADPNEFAPAVKRQYANALIRIGVAAGAHFASAGGLPTPAGGVGPFRSKPSAETLIRRLAQERPFRSSQPLLGADIVLAALSSDYGTVPRALAVMGIDAARLAEACRLETGASGTAG